jgi:epoxyqueuosine reductase
MTIRLALKIARWYKFCTGLRISTMNLKECTELIKNEAAALGFSACGISKADFLESEAPRLEEWLKRNLCGNLLYMADHSELRLDPRKYMPGARSVVSLLYNYYSDIPDKEKAAYRISCYAFGRDYHLVIKKKLNQLIDTLRGKIGEIEARSCVDTAPVMEKVWAARSGLGWIGKNCNLIRPDSGSFYFLAELLLDIDLEYDSPAVDHCGKCRRCIDICPTGAIVEPYVVDACRCISYLTIELKTAIPEEMTGKYSDWIFGCDLCQEVCPFNRFATPHQEPAFKPKPEIFEMSVDQWRKLTPRRFEELFQGSALKRAKHEGLMRNIRFLNR